MSGLKHNVNLLVDYDDDWPRMFLEVQSRISKAVGGVAKAIEHYGSTAMPGMRAKPILDILIGLDPLEVVAECRQRGFSSARRRDESDLLLPPRRLAWATQPSPPRLATSRSR